MAVGWARIAACFSAQDPYSGGFKEALEHFGLRCDVIERASPAEIGRCHVLLLCGFGVLPAADREALHKWVTGGGVIVCCGSAWNIEDILGISGSPTHLSSGWLQAAPDSPFWPEGCESAYFLGARGHRATEAQALLKLASGHVGLSVRKLGRGMAIFFAPQIGQSVVQMQLGRSVECDAIGPDDGSARLDDGILRAEDGTCIEFGTRTKPDSGSPFFGAAHSDTLRQVYQRAVLYAIEAADQATLIPWYWPDHADASACLSLDCEDDGVDGVVATHRVLATYGLPCAWLVSLPGFSSDVYRTFRAREHEIGLLFGVEEANAWSEERLRSQMTQLGRLSSVPHVVSVRPRDGCWHRWTHFYEMCEFAGTRISLSKGGRQAGTQGFLFGTCHPFHPDRQKGHGGSHTLEIPYQTYQLGTLTPEVNDAIVDEVKRQNGCFHFAELPASFLDQHQSNEIRRVIASLRERRFALMRPLDIANFERGRRSARWGAKSIDGEIILAIAAEHDISGLSLLATSNVTSILVAGKEVPTRRIRRFGRDMVGFTVDLLAKHACEIRMRVISQERAA